MLHKCLLALALLVTTVFSVSGATDDWPRFRGPSAGIADDDPALPDAWSSTENVVWKIDIPGIGWSSPVIWGDHIFLTTVVNTAQQEPPKPGFYLGDWPASTAPHRWMAYDVDFTTGKIRWEREVGSAPPGHPKHLKNSYASETPVTDGERVYFYFANAGLFAFDLTGRPLWSQKMGPFKTRNNWGTGGSPILHGDRVYVLNDNDDQSFLAAYDSRTGAEIWRVNRAEGTNWSTPFVWENEQRTEIVTSGSDRVRSYDLSGKVLWELSGMSTISIPTPFARHGLLYIASGYIGDALRPAYAIRPGASGDISLKGDDTTNPYIVWSSRAGAPYNPTPIVYGDYYYTLFDRGFFTNHDARTGKEIYGRQRITADASGFTASPWAYNGRIFAMSEDGDTYVIQAGTEFKLLGKNSLNEIALATPGVARGSLVIRTASKLYRFTKGR
ncbi:MAG: serine/threonine protein kinase [Acidobacteria bacterium]|nr:MAG: serine/threonine protein kinase [Acidobacteriota bacterium]